MYGTVQRGAFIPLMSFFLDLVGYVQVLILASIPPGRAGIHKSSRVHKVKCTSQPWGPCGSRVILCILISVVGTTLIAHVCTLLLGGW